MNGFQAEITESQERFSPFYYQPSGGSRDSSSASIRPSFVRAVFTPDSPDSDRFGTKFRSRDSSPSRSVSPVQYFDDPLSDLVPDNQRQRREYSSSPPVSPLSPPLSPPSPNGLTSGSEADAHDSPRSYFSRPPAKSKMDIYNLLSHEPGEISPRFPPPSPQESISSRGKDPQPPQQQDQSSSSRILRAIPPSSHMTFTQPPPRRNTSHKSSPSDPGSLPSNGAIGVEMESRRLRDRNIPISLERPPATRSPAVPALNYDDLLPKLNITPLGRGKGFKCHWCGTKLGIGAFGAVRHVLTHISPISRVQRTEDEGMRKYLEDVVEEHEDLRRMRDSAKCPVCCQILSRKDAVIRHMREMHKKV